MTAKTKAPAKDKETEDTSEIEDVLIEHVGMVAGEKVDIRVDIRQYGDSPPSIRLNRVGVKKDGKDWIGALGSIKSAQEATSLAKMLVTAAAALTRANK